MADIRLGRSEDFAEVMERVVASFRERNPAHLRFEVLYPDSVRPETMCQWRVALVDGEIAAGIQVVPRMLVCGGSALRLPGMGLGNVFCYPSFRKQGLMSALLERCIEDMEAAGIGICLLGGDRARYGNFGWEHAGTDRSLTLSSSVRRFTGAPPEVSSVDLDTWQGDQGVALHMLSAYCGLPYRTERTAKEFARVLSRPGQVVWICDDDAHGFAYVSVRRNSILEYAGCAEALAQLLSYLLRTGTWTVSLPPVEGEGPLETMLLEYAQHYAVRPTGMIRVISLKTVFEAYMPLLRDRLQGWDGDIAFRAADNGETVAIVGDSGSVSIESRSSDSLAVELDRRELARLLFGPFPPALGDWFRHSAVRRIFPLPLHWHALAHV